MAANNPSWLTEEVVQKAAQNPVVQKVAQNVAKEVANDMAKDPQKYVNAYNQSNQSNQPNWSNQPNPNWSSQPDPEIGRGSTPAVSEPGADMTESELKEVKRSHLILRFLYIAISVCMCAAAFLALAGASFTGFFIAGYVFSFSVLVCCFETGIGAIAKGKLNFLN